MDFFQIVTKEVKGGGLEVHPDFTIGRSKDLMVQGKSFYAIWDEARGLWSTDEYDVQRLVDEELRAYVKKNGYNGNIKYMSSLDSNSWANFRRMLALVSDNAHPLDASLTFANTVVKKGDYVSRRLPYSLAPGDISAWEELIGTLYTPEEKAKIEWAIGAIVSGDSKKLQKFMVLFGPPGAGKGTVLDIIKKLFVGYTTTFEAKALVGNNNAFATEMFKSNPLVAIQADGDLSKIEDNTKLNTLVSHEEMTMNEKYKPGYSARIHAFLILGTNYPVKITNAMSGIIRRLIDVTPSGNRVTKNHYVTLMARIDFELGAIAQHCLDAYRQMGKNHYHDYRPLEMMFKTDIFFNFVEAYYDIFNEQDGATLKQAYSLYKEYCSETGIDRVLPQYKVREELRNYFEDFKDRAILNGEPVRSYYSGFTARPFKAPIEDDARLFTLVMDESESLLDQDLAEQPAQYANLEGSPKLYWDDSERLIKGEVTNPKPDQIVSTTLSDLDTTQLHFVKVPENHIVIDFDIVDETGAKSLEQNLGAASFWPATYAELSKSGAGVHLHYLYDGDIEMLAPEYSKGIEVKVFRGNSSLRRRLSKCNNVPVATINSGLPLKEKKKVLDTATIQSEKGLRALIGRNLKKEIHPHTKSSVDFIKKILDEAYGSGMKYDVTDLRAKLCTFAFKSSNNSLVCLKIVQDMKFASEESAKTVVEAGDDRLVFFDVEVYPNLFVVCWKYEGDADVVPMINPTAQEIEQLFKLKLVGFYNRRYDNHIVWARYMGYTLDALYRLSQKIVSGKGNEGMFGEAYSLSWADVWDFSSIKNGLKKFEIDLGIHHQEMDIPWDQPVPENRIQDVVDYCCNDVRATEAVFNDRRQDYVARQILADLSGLTINDTTQQHTAKIVFGNDRDASQQFVYTDLSQEFPGYVYDYGKSTYWGEETGEGGYVYAEKGMYDNVAVLDIASMHPTTIENLNLFGEYTENFNDLTRARLAIKHGDFEAAREMLGGKLTPYLKDETVAEALGYALKIVVNIVYGLTSAKFDNAFRDRRNKDNIVAKRGALFMINLKHAVQDKGFQVVHIKTDSIKIPNATPKIIEFVKEFGDTYGYAFEHEATYKKFCLVNNAVYIAKYGWAAKEKKIGKWDAVGAQFQHPYVFKRLFEPGEGVMFNDLCETKEVSQGGVMYLDFTTTERSAADSEEMRFIGRTGRFLPVREGFGGGTLYRRSNDGKLSAVVGTKGHLWVEAEVALHHGEDTIDMTYFHKLVEKAKKTIQEFGDFEEFVKDE